MSIVFIFKMYQILLVLIFLMPISSVCADTVGKPRVIDGDTIEIAGDRIRLKGIDAPEAKQMCLEKSGDWWRCGEVATFALLDLVGSHWITCKGKKRDHYGRLIAVCYVGPYDLNSLMVSRGHAMAYRKYSRVYAKEESIAKTKKLGLWRGQFIPPWNWRRGKRLKSEGNR